MRVGRSAPINSEPSSKVAHAAWTGWSLPSRTNPSIVRTWPLTVILTMRRRHCACFGSRVGREASPQLAAECASTAPGRAGRRLALSLLFEEPRATGRRPWPPRWRSGRVGACWAAISASARATLILDHALAATGWRRGLRRSGRSGARFAVPADDSDLVLPEARVLAGLIGAGVA
jgi:hypothetical protein